MLEVQTYKNGLVVLWPTQYKAKSYWRVYCFKASCKLFTHDTSHTNTLYCCNSLGPVLSNCETHAIFKHKLKVLLLLC